MATSALHVVTEVIGNWGKNKKKSGYNSILTFLGYHKPAKQSLGASQNLSGTLVSFTGSQGKDMFLTGNLI